MTRALSLIRTAAARLHPNGDSSDFTMFLAFEAVVALALICIGMSPDLTAI